VPAIVSLAVGLGARYPDFKSENPALSATSFGGVLFMLLSFGLIALVIILEAGPVYRIFMSRMHGHSFSLWQMLWFVFSFSLALFLCVFAVFYPMKLGEKICSKDDCPPAGLQADRIGKRGPGNRQKLKIILILLVG